MERHKRGSRFTILAVTEGAISREDAELPKRECRKKRAQSKYPSVSYEIAAKIQKKSGLDVRVTVPGTLNAASPRVRTIAYSPPDWVPRPVS